MPMRAIDNYAVQMLGRLLPYQFQLWFYQSPTLFCLEILASQIVCQGIEVLRHRVGGFQEFSMRSGERSTTVFLFSSSFVCFSWKDDYSWLGAIYSALWDLVYPNYTPNTVCYIFNLSHEYRRPLSTLFNLLSQWSKHESFLKRAYMSYFIIMPMSYSPCSSELSTSVFY